MALADEAKADGLPEEVVAEIEGAQEGGEGREGGAEGEAPVTIRLSRRKKEQQEREERLKAAEDRAAAAERIANELRQQSAQESAHLRGTLEQMQRQFTASQQQPTARPAAEEPIERRISTEMKAAEAALKASDLGEYHERMGRLMDLRAEAKAQAIIAAQPKPQVQQQPQQQQRPPWVMAIEMQYPDVLSHPRGQQTVGIVDQLLSHEPWGPDRLHKAFQRARTELGMKPAAAPAPAAGQRALYGSIQTSGTGGGGRRGADGSESVTVPKEYLSMATRSGMTKAQAAKAWKDSYPDE